MNLIIIIKVAAICKVAEVVTNTLECVRHSRDNKVAKRVLGRCEVFI